MGTKNFTKVVLVDGTGTAISASNPVSMSIQAGNDAMAFAERSFTETDVAGVYTATIVLPAGAVVNADDVWLSNQALWTNAASAAFSAGDAANAAGFFSAVNIKTTPAADVNGLGGIKATGAYGGKQLHYAAGGTISAVVTTGVGAGHAGLTRFNVRYVVPTTVPVAVKV